MSMANATVSVWSTTVGGPGMRSLSVMIKPSMTAPRYLSAVRPAVSRCDPPVGDHVTPHTRASAHLSPCVPQIDLAQPTPDSLRALDGRSTELFAQFPWQTG